MKILQLITENQLRGAEVFAAQLSDLLAARGHQVVLAHLLGEAGALTTGPRVRQVGLGGTVGASWPLQPAVWRALRRTAEEFDPDIIQANGSETLKYAALLRMVDKSCPVVYRNISVMSMWTVSSVKTKLVGAALRRMSHIASVTSVGERVLIEKYGLSPARVSTVPIGVAIPPELSPDVQTSQRVEARAALQAQLSVPAEAPLVIHVGSFTPEKNHAELISAFARVVDAVPEAHLLLVGEGPLRSSVSALVDEAGLEQRVTFAGSVPDAARLTAIADVLVLPSLREGLPGVILEAGVAGVPVVAYDVGGVKEVVKDGVTGVVVPMGDVKALTEEMTRLLASPSLRDELGSTSRARLSTAYSLERVADNFEALYESLASRAG